MIVIPSGMIWPSRAPTVCPNKPVTPAGRATPARARRQVSHHTDNSTLSVDVVLRQHCVCCSEVHVACCAAQQLGFHQQRLAAEALDQQDRQLPLAVSVRFVVPTVFARNKIDRRSLASTVCREAETDAEFKAISWLRAKSFYAYPPERAFAGQVRVRAIQKISRKRVEKTTLRADTPSHDSRGRVQSSHS